MRYIKQSRRVQEWVTSSIECPRVGSVYQEASRGVQKWATCLARSASMSDQRCPENPPHQPTLAWEFALPDSQCLRTFCSLVFFGWSAFKLQKTVKFLQSERTFSNHFHYFLEGRSVALGKIYLCDGTSEHCVPGVIPPGHDCHALLFFLGVDGNMLLRCRFFFFFRPIQGQLKEHRTCYVMLRILLKTCSERLCDPAKGDLFIYLFWCYAVNELHSFLNPSRSRLHLDWRCLTQIHLWADFKTSKLSV